MADEYWPDAMQNAVKIEKSDIDPKTAAKFFTILFNNSPIGIYIIQNGKFKYANPQFQKLTGYGLDELQGITSPLRLVHPKDRYTVRENAEEMIKGERSSPYQYRYVKKNGDIGWALETVVMMTSASKTKTVLGNFIDITGLKIAEKELSHSQEYHRILFDHYRDAVFVLTPGGRFIQANPSACRLLGFEREDLHQMTIFDLSASGDGTAPLFDKLLLQGHVFGEISFQTKGGGNVIAEINATALPDENYLCTVRNITERKQIEGKLREREEKYRELVKHAPVGIYEIDFINLRFVTVNDVMCQYTGYTKEEFLSLNPLEILSDESKKHFIERLRKFSSGEVLPNTVEFEIKGKDGRLFAVLINARYKYENGVPVGATVIAHDITERKRAEEELRLSEERFFKAFNASPVPMIIISSTSYKVTDVNNSFLKTTGYTGGEVIGKAIKKINFWQGLRDLAKIKKAILKYGAIYNYDLIYLAKSGERRTGLFSAEIIDLNGDKCVLATINDITERKIMEKEMARLEQLNLVGEMAAGIGHEVRNPMTSVRGLLQMLSGKEDCIKYREYFGIMIEELDRANSIITEYLSLARNRPLDLKKNYINSIIETLAPLIAADSANSNIKYNIDLHDTAQLLLDEKQIRQLILNLIRNGLEEMEPGGTITIKTYTEGNEVVLAVQDQGRGINPEIIDKIGNPFFTTKENGTGLGLAVCYSIATRHMATIKIETGPSGTTFFVRFKATVQG